MHCEEWTERLTAEVTERRKDPELEAHLTSCARCRSELAGLQETWGELARLPDEDVPSDEMRSRLLAALPARGRRRAPALRFAAAALVAGLAFLAGQYSASAGDPSADSRPRYLLLLHERPGRASETAAEQRAVVEEYKAWARRLRAAGKLVGGEKLGDAGTVLSAAGSADLAGVADRVGGYFVIRAATPDDALAIARDCPHVRRGGTVELRRIEEV